MAPRHALSCVCLITGLVLAAIDTPTAYVSSRPSEPRPFLSQSQSTDAIVGDSDCLPSEFREQIQREIADYEAHKGGYEKLTDARNPYPVWPLAGVPGEDAHVGNYVDLDTGPGIRAWDCTPTTYDGHMGHDISLGFDTFAVMAIGLPIFAALDGTVVAAHDGEPDMNTSCTGTANYVTIDHGGGHYSIYAHMKRNSVAVTAGQQVTAGRQLGLMGSSGCSTGPHLHFESQLNNVAYEPFAGLCNVGPSYWVDQPSKLQSIYFGDFYFRRNDGARIGTLLAGFQTIGWSYTVYAVPQGSNMTFVFRRPDGGIASQGGPFNQGSGTWGWNWTVNANVPGTWYLEMSINGTLALRQPFTVVTSASEIVNHAPFTAAPTFYPPAPSVQDAIVCKAESDVLREDPDYDGPIRYHYVWRVNGALVRDVISAGRSDILAKGSTNVGDSVSCVVTVSDGTLTSAPTTATTTIMVPTGGRRTPFDYDGDRKAEVGIFRPFDGTWWLLGSATSQVRAQQWALAGDLPVSGDFDGDGKADIAVWRPSSGTWYILNSSTGGGANVRQWGLNGDIPVPGDYDGDGKTDTAVFRPSGGLWYILQSSNQQVRVVQWALPGDLTVPADYDGDGKADIAVYRPSGSQWYIIQSGSSQVRVAQWGLANDKATPADYDGDGKADIAIWRPAGGTWWILHSSNGQVRAQQWGLIGDTPVPADYDGDGKADTAVFRPFGENWFILNSANGSVRTQQWGLPLDVALPSVGVR